MGEGNHHGDHHDFPRDYRNGFGLSGWLLDPTRYGILALNALGLVRGLNSASKHEEAEIIAQRKLAELNLFRPITREAAVLRDQLEKTALTLKNEWVEALAHVDKLKQQSKLLARARAGREELIRDLELARNKRSPSVRKRFTRLWSDCGSTQRYTLNRETPSFQSDSDHNDDPMTEWLAEHWLAVTLFALYTIALMRNALSGLRVSQSMRGFYVGNRNLSGPLIGLSFFATFASTNSYIGHAGKGYEYGLLDGDAIHVDRIYLHILALDRTSHAFVGCNFDALTLPDFLAARFLNGESDGREPLRVIAAFVVMFCSLLYLVAILKGAGHLFERFFNVPYQVAIGLALIIVMLYTSIGGFVSVVRTDALQGVLMMIGAVLIFYFVTSAAGGVSAINQLSVSADKQFLFEINGGIPFVVLLGISLSGSLKLIVDPRQTSRFFALKDDAALRSGMWVAIVGLTIVQLCLYPIGIYAHLLIDGVSDTDLIVPTPVNNAAIFPIWAGDFLFVAIVAAAMSSMDSVLLVAASTGYKT